jgi:hypothetical protein
MSYPLTREQALSILDIFGGQYPWSDVSGYLLAVAALGLIDPSAASDQTLFDASTSAEAITAGGVAPSGQASDAPAVTTPVETPTTPAEAPTTPAEPTPAPVEAPVATPNPDGSPAA